MALKSPVETSVELLVLNKEAGNKMFFMIRGRHWAVYNLLIAIGIGAGAYYAKSFSEYEKMIGIIGIIVPVLFLYSSLFSLMARTELEINGETETVQYLRSDLYKKKSWSKKFQDFKEVTIYRPGRKAFLKIALVPHDGETIHLGTSEAGIYGLDKAKNLAQRISKIMKISINEAYHKG